MKYKSYVYDEFFDTTVKQRILQFFRESKDDLSTKEISEKLEIPQASVNRALNDLEKLKILKSKEEGKFRKFELNPDVSKQFDHIFQHMEEVRKFTMEQRKRTYKDKEDDK